MNSTRAPSPREETEAAAGRQTSVRAWSIVALLFLFMLINFADKSVFGLAGPSIIAEFDLSHTTFGLLGSSFFLLFAVSGVATGFAANRAKSKWLLAGMSIVWALMQLLPIALPSLSAFFLARILLGAGEGPAAPIAQHALYKWFEDQRRTLPTGIVTVGVPLGGGLAAPALTYVIGGWGWRAAFALLAAAGLLWSALWLALGREGPVADRMPERVEAEPHIPYRHLLLNGTVVGALIAGFGGYWCLILAVIWLPLYLVGGAGYNPSEAGWIVALPFVATAVIMPGSGWLSQSLQARGASSRQSRGLLACLGTAGSGAAMAAMALLPNGWPHIVLLTLAFSLGSAVLVVGPPLVAELTPAHQRAAVLGIITAIATSAGLLAPVVMGRIVDAGSDAASGYRNGFLVVAVMAIVAGIVGLVLIRPERDRARLVERFPAMPFRTGA